MNSAKMNGQVEPIGTNGRSVSEILHTLSPEEKTTLFEAFVREMTNQCNGNFHLPLETASGEWLGNFVLPSHPGAAADRLFASLDLQTRSAIVQSCVDLELTGSPTADEMNQILNDTYARLDVDLRDKIMKPYLDLDLDDAIPAKELLSKLSADDSALSVR